MNYYQTLVLAIVLLFIQADLLALAQNEVNDCDNNNGNYTRNGAYSANLNTTLSSLSTNISSEGFYNASTGLGIDRVNALALCRGDVQLDDCRDCVRAAAADLLQSCPNQKQAIYWDDYCMLRYSNATIYGILATSPGYNLPNSQNVTSPDQFKGNLRALLAYIGRQAAAGSSLWKVAAGNATGTGFQTIFGLLQCTPDLSSEECTSCLVGAISIIPQCCEWKVGGRVLRPSCNLHFETYPFFNETRLQRLDSVEPPPGSNDNNTSPGKNSKDDNTTKLIIIIAVPVGVALIFAVCAIFFIRKRRKRTRAYEITERNKTNQSAVDDISDVDSLRYDFSSIRAATRDFDYTKKLGQGGFGAVYKGTLQSGEEVAVKRLSRFSRMRFC